jgi:transposase-like protein
MTYKKLPEPEKQEILRLYLAGEGTIPSLAEQYGISTTTVRRILKGTDSPASEAPPAPTLVAVPNLASAESNRRSRRRTSVPSQPEPILTEQIAITATAKPIADPKIQEIEITEAVEDIAPATSPAPPVLKRQQAIAAEIEAELVDFSDDDLNKDLDDDDLGDDDLDDDLDLDDDDLDGDEALWEQPQLQTNGLVHIVPLAEANLPKTCYLVVDRVAELITRPLKDFGELGQFPEAEIQQKTLPVFDNHRVAKRFANPRTQRVIKLPDSRLLQNTSAHLWAKGITRLLVNGQVYSLEAAEV